VVELLVTCHSQAPPVSLCASTESRSDGFVGSVYSSSSHFIRFSICLQPHIRAFIPEGPSKLLFLDVDLAFRVQDGQKHCVSAAHLPLSQFILPQLPV